MEDDSDDGEEKSLYQVTNDNVINLLSANAVPFRPQLCRDGDLKTVKSLLSKISDTKLPKVINQLDPNKISALHYAARYDHLNLVRLLVEKDADPSIRGDDGLTPLHHCAK